MERLAVLRYAKAIFELAVEKNAVEAYSRAARDVLGILTDNGEFQTVINHPAITLEQKVDALKATFSGRIPDDFIGLFALLIKRGRKDEILGVLRHFEVLYMEYIRRAHAKLYICEDLPEEKIAQITQILSNKLQKTIIIEKIIDKNIIAGFRVEVEGYVFDASIKHQLGILKNQLL